MVCVSPNHISSTHTIYKILIEAQVLRSKSLVQLEVLDGLVRLAPFSEENLWETTYRQLVSYIPSKSVVDACLKCDSPDELNAQHAALVTKNQVEFSKRVISTIDAIYKSAEAPPAVQIQLYGVLVRSLGGVMMSRYIGDGSYGLWKPAVKSLQTITKVALPLLLSSRSSRK
eukprot:gene7197-364_t